MLAGNNKSGIRAVAAARHLRNHGPNVVVCVLGLERESELLVGLRRQLKVFRTFGGKLVTKVRMIFIFSTAKLSILGYQFTLEILTQSDTMTELSTDSQ